MAEPGEGGGEDGLGQDAGGGDDGGHRPSPPPDRSGWLNPIRYSALVGLVFIGVIVFTAVSTFGGDGERILGATGEQAGTPLAMFAVPDVRGELDGDANIDQTDCEVDSIPCPPERARPSACEIEVEGAIRVCDLFDRPLVISWWFTRGGDCLPTQDIVDQASRRWGDRVGFLSVNVRDDRDRVREIASERGWRIPVGWDRDGEASNLYRVGVCPTIVLARTGGILERVILGSLEEQPEQLDEAIGDLVDASREAQRQTAG